MSHSTPPYDYSVRVSSRARHVRIAVKPFRGLEVVIPKRFPVNQIPGILHQHNAWITKQLQKHASFSDEIGLPQQINLRLLRRIFTLEYSESDKKSLIEQENSLKLVSLNQQQTLQQLRSWVRQKAHQVLPVMLNETAIETGLSYKKISIRSQKSRWGSYSSRGTLSLNDQLLFMPEDTVRYLLIHELCHSRYMNHSSGFWYLVEQCCPDFREHEKVLAKGSQLVPEWFRYSLYSG